MPQSLSSKSLLRAHLPQHPNTWRFPQTKPCLLNWNLSEHKREKEAQNSYEFWPEQAHKISMYENQTTACQS